MIMKKIIFYLLSFTWGIVYSIIGLLVTLIMLVTGHKPKMFKTCWYFIVGNTWGGCNFGPCIVIGSNCESCLPHEFGHAIQNCIFGPTFPFLIAIPSMLRYWYRELYFKALHQIFEAISVTIIVFATFIISLMLLHMYAWWLYIILCVDIYVLILIFWVVYIEGIKYKNNWYPEYNEIWFEKTATNLGKKLVNKI